MTDSSVLTLANVNKRYQGKATQNDVEALKDINISVAGGEFLALLGPSGCGKSTLLLTAAGLLKPDSGDVTLFNQNIYKLTNAERAAFRAANLGFVFQQFHLIPYLTVSANIRVADIAKNETWQAPDLNEILEKFGLTDRAEHVPSQLSVGEQQRVALARAVYAGNKLIYADEPTGNLDRENADIVLDYLAEFADKGGAVLMVTHDDRAVERASRKINMNKGTIVD